MGLYKGGIKDDEIFGTLFLELYLDYFKNLYLKDKIMKTFNAAKNYDLSLHQCD